MPILYRDEQRVLFVHIPRSAGTSVALWFAANHWRITNLELQSEPLRALFWRRAGVEGIPLEGGQPPVVSPQHATRDTTAGWGPFSSAFAVVREPIDRILAHVRWIHPRMPQADGGLQPLADFANAYLGEILDRLAHDRTVQDNHIRPQVDFLGDDVEVLYYECDWPGTLRDRYGLTGDPPAVHGSPRTREPIALEARVADRLLSVCAPDYEQLGYALPSLQALTRGRSVPIPSMPPGAGPGRAAPEVGAGDSRPLPRGRGRRIVFLWTKTLLDRRSGAAVDLKVAFEALARHGFDCHAVSMTLFDGRDPFPLERLIGAGHADAANRGRFLEAPHRGICHWLYLTGGTVEPDLTASDVQGFAGAVERLLARLQPDLVVTTGAGALCEHLHGVAHRHARRTAFFLANPSYHDPRVFEPFDSVVCPSRTLAMQYWERLGVGADIMRDVFAPEQFVRPRAGAVDAPGRGFVTLINPAPEKGAMLFFRLLELARRERPDIRFLAVEGRVSRAEWARVGLDPADFPNLWWVRNRRDMRPVYRRTALLLCPSLWFEPSARVVAEAQLSGVPVIATRRGGIPEQMNGGGVLIEPPSASLDDFLYVPSRAEIRPWLDHVVRLLDDPDVHAEASERALAAAAPFHPDVRIPDLVREFDALAPEAN